MAVVTRAGFGVDALVEELELEEVVEEVVSETVVSTSGGVGASDSEDELVDDVVAGSKVITPGGGPLDMTGLPVFAVWVVDELVAKLVASVTVESSVDEVADVSCADSVELV